MTWQADAEPSLGNIMYQVKYRRVLPPVHSITHMRFAVLAGLQIAWPVSSVAVNENTTTLMLGAMHLA